METAKSEEITGLLRAWGTGDQAALDRLTPLVYETLHQMARAYMRRERPDNSLQATALVNEAYLRLVDIAGAHCEDRVHFFSLSARLMRRILVDAARADAAGKRGGQARKVAHPAAVNLEEVADASSRRGSELIAIDDALTGLAQIDDRKARVVELRFFSGLSVEESAEVLGVSPETVMRDWKMAKAWLTRELQK